MVSVVILDLTMLLCGFLMHIINQLKHLRRFIVETQISRKETTGEIALLRQVPHRHNHVSRYLSLLVK
jgi:hypothetical protein